MTMKPPTCGDCSRFNDELRLCDGLPIPRPDWFDYATSKPTCTRDPRDAACKGGAFVPPEEEAEDSDWDIFGWEGDDDVDD